MAHLLLSIVGFLRACCAGNGAPEHTAQMKQMIADWTEVIRKANIQVD